MNKEVSLGDCWQWKANGQCYKGDNCSFRHDVNKRAKMTQPNPSPNSFMPRTRSPRGKSRSGGHAEKYTTIGLRISGYGAAEVFIDFAEEIKHTETNPMCSIH